MYCNNIFKGKYWDPCLRIVLIIRGYELTGPVLPRNHYNLILYSKNRKVVLTNKAKLHSGRYIQTGLSKDKFDMNISIQFRHRVKGTIGLLRGMDREGRKV